MRSGRDARRPATKWTPDRRATRARAATSADPSGRRRTAGSRPSGWRTSPAAGSSSTSSRCGVARKAMSTAKRPSSSVVALAAMSPATDHSSVSGDLGGPDRPRAAPSARRRCRRRVSGRCDVGPWGAGANVHRRHHQRAAPSTAARRCAAPGRPAARRARHRRPTPAAGPSVNAGSRCSHIRSSTACICSVHENIGDDGVLLGQHDHVLAVGAVAAVAVLRHPQLEAVALLPVRLLALRVGDLHRRRLGHPTLGEQPGPSHTPSSRYSWPSRAIASRLVYTPEKPMSKPCRQPRPAQVGDAERVERPVVAR